MKTTQEKNELIESIQIQIEDLHCDIDNELHSEEDLRDSKHDIDSLKTILGHLITLKTI